MLDEFYTVDQLLTFVVLVGLLIALVLSARLITYIFDPRDPPDLGDIITTVVTCVATGVVINKVVDEFANELAN